MTAVLSLLSDRKLASAHSGRRFFGFLKKFDIICAKGTPTIFAIS